MTVKVRWTQPVIEKLRRMAESGMTDPQIAEAFNLGRDAILKARKRYKIPSPLERRAANAKNIILAANEQGKSIVTVRWIADEFAAKPHEVRKTLAKMEAKGACELLDDDSARLNKKATEILERHFKAERKKQTESCYGTFKPNDYTICHRMR